jgi:carbonic anhydrase
VPTPRHSFCCHDHAHYSAASTAIDRRRFIQLATLGGGAMLLGLATPWRLARAEAGREPPIQPKLEPKARGQGPVEHGTAHPAGAVPAHTAEALLLSCMDYRLIDDITRYMDGRGMTNQYDHIVLAGASLGALTDHCKEWNKTFWEHLKIASDLHHIKKVILMDHRDCGAYKVILKADFSKDPQMETRVHGKFLRDLMVAIHKRYPELEVERLMMNLDGTVQKIS